MSALKNNNERGLVMDQKLLTVGELAEFLRVKKSWVYSKTREKGPDAIPMIIVGKYRRFCPDLVMKWLKEQGGNSR